MRAIVRVRNISVIYITVTVILKIAFFIKEIGAVGFVADTGTACLGSVAQDSKNRKQIINIFFILDNIIPPP